MNEFGPPTLPPAGWYPDPYQPTRQRWWDGREWSDSYAPASTDTLPEVGDLIGGGFRRMSRRWRALATIGVITGVPAAVLPALMFSTAFDDLEIVDGEVLGWTDDRVGPLVVLGIIVILAGLLSAIAAPLLMLDDHDVEAPLGWPPNSDDARTTPSEMRAGWRAIVRALAVVPRLLGWSMVLVLAAMIPILVLVAVAAAAGAVVIVLFLAMVPLFVWLWVKFSFLAVSVIDRRGMPFGRSWDVSRGQFWAVLGRLLLVALIGFGVGLALNMVGTIGRGGGATTEAFEFDPTQSSSFNASLGGLVDASPLGLVVGAITAVISAVVITGMSSAVSARLYRTRNPRNAG